MLKASRVSVAGYAIERFKSLRSKFVVKEVLTQKYLISLSTHFVNVINRQTTILIDSG